MMLATKLARLLLIAALLVAQHSALAHGLQHLADPVAAQHSGSSNDPLCDQHLALGTVLGALGNGDAPAAVAVPRACAVPSAALAIAPAALLAPSSRDPPTLP